MKKLRLLFTEDCNRNCKGCCNNDFDLKNLPAATHFDYDIIMITGGEPFLHIEKLEYLIQEIRVKSDAKIYVYTAKIDKILEFGEILSMVDGMTVTLHTKGDEDCFGFLNDYLHYCSNKAVGKSMRLNIFKGINVYPSNFWQVKEYIEWIKNCPLPEDEVFLRYK